MLATKESSIIKQIPSRVGTPGLWYSEQRFCAIGLSRTARDVVLRRAIQLDWTASAERWNRTTAVDFDASDAVGVAADREALFDEGAHGFATLGTRAAGGFMLRGRKAGLGALIAMVRVQDFSA